jgi:hypothetical protein
MMTAMEMGRRPLSGWVAIVARALAFGSFAAAALIRGQGRLVLVGVGLGMVLVAITRRRKAPRAPGAIYSSSADLLLGDGHRLAGQLSVTPAEIVWAPGPNSVSHGAESISIAAQNCSTISLHRGPAMLDVILTVDAPDGERRFMTHRSRGLRRSIGALLD